MGWHELPVHYLLKKGTCSNMKQKIVLVAIRLLNAKQAALHNASAVPSIYLQKKGFMLSQSLKAAFVSIAWHFCKKSMLFLKKYVFINSYDRHFISG